MNLIPIEVPMTISNETVVIPMNVEAPQMIDMTIGATYAMSVADDYEGDYHVTPNLEQQTLLTKDKKMSDHVVIDPIPKNYGRITYNGTTIKIS